MKMLKRTFLAALSIMVSCASGDFERDDFGIVVERGDMTISLEVVNESIIHVTKSRAGVEVAELPDFVTVMEPQRTKWRASSRGGVTTLSTSKVEVSVDAEGVIEYRDRSGRNLVAESRETTWIDPQNQTETPISQGFVAGDEALYGLGQYQSGVMNLRAMPIRMEQFNQEIVIPFVVSTNGYGIYWHNYSRAYFNRAESILSFEDSEFEAAEAVKLKAGVEVEDVANHAVQKSSESIQATTFTPEKSGLYTFFVDSDVKTRMRGDIKLIIEGDTIVDYSTIWVPKSHTGSKVLTAGEKYRVTFQNNGASVAGSVSYNEPDYDKTTFSSTAGSKIEYYLVVGENPEEVVYNYQDLTGRAQMFSKKSYGFWHCREKFNNQKELLEIATTYREKGIPVDNIVQDWQYWPAGTKGPEWDRVKFPDVEAMTAQLSEQNYNLMVSVWPTITNDPLLSNYGLLDSKLRNNYLDFYDEKVRDGYYKILSDSMFHKGVRSIWLDGSEPEGVPDNVPTVLGNFKGLANTYSLLVSKSVYEGRREEFPAERVFNLTRSAYAGQQRYGVASWSGDVEASWEQLEEQIVAGQHFSMAGVPYWTHDIGGFFRDSKSMNDTYDNQYTNAEYKELLSRWFQFGAFSPLFRLHGYKSNTEVWNYGAEFEALARKYIELRYTLLPYIYSEAWRVTNDSNLLMAPLAYEYPDDKSVWDIKSQYLFGESIMVAPVVEYLARTKSVYLPKGVWYNFWSGEKMSGGRRVEVSAELDELPIFVKGGSIIPLGPKVQYADESTDEPIRLRVYGGEDAEFELYLDAGENYEYEDGKYTILKVSYDEKSKSVTLESAYDKYVDFEKNPQRFVVELVGGAEQTITYSSGSKTTKL